MSSGRPLWTLAGAGAGLALLLGAGMATSPAPVAASEQPVAASATPPASASIPAAAASTQLPPAPSTRAGVPSSFPAEAVYVGRASDGRTSVALAVWGERARAYVCDGRSVEAWLTGTVAAATAELSGPGAALTAQYTGGTAAVRVRVGTRTLTATVVPARKPAGLYRGNSQDGRTTVGWIVLPDGRQVGIVNRAGTVAAAPSLPPDGSVDIGGESITAAEVRGDERP